MRKTGSKREKLQKVKEGKKRKENIFFFFLLTISGNETCPKADRLKNTVRAKEDSDWERNEDDKSL